MMSTNIQTNNTTVSNLPSTQILLAESDLLEVARIRAKIDREFQYRIKIIKNYNELILEVAKEQPQIIILGRIDKLNYFEVCQACRKLWSEMPIVLISRQEMINYSFRQVVKSYGVTEIISQDFEKLNQLLQTLDLLQQPTNNPDRPIVTGEMMLEALSEIVTVSNNYFGPLAQGNYWRKAHARVGESEFMLNWSADHFSKLNCNDNILEQELTDQDIQSLRAWVQNFIEECDRIIIDFGVILHNSELSSLAKDLLNKSS
jgi:CheY-like chemotaxis protein